MDPVVRRAAATTTALFLVVLAGLPAVLDADIDPASWSHSLPVTIAERSGTTLLDYQVLIVLDTHAWIAEGSLQSSCADIRFTSDGQTELPHWLEGGCGSETARFWVRVPQVPAGGSAVLTLYHGNPDAPSVSYGRTVFPLLFDDGDARSDGAALSRGGWQAVAGSEPFQTYSTSEPYPDGVNHVSLRTDSVSPGAEQEAWYYLPEQTRFAVDFAFHDDYNLAGGDLDSFKDLRLGHTAIDHHIASVGAATGDWTQTIPYPSYRQCNTYYFVAPVPVGEPNACLPPAVRSPGWHTASITFDGSRWSTVVDGRQVTVDVPAAAGRDRINHVHIRNGRQEGRNWGISYHDVVRLRSFVSPEPLVVVGSVNRPPVAEAGLDLRVNEGERVELDASATHDPDGDPLVYQWTELVGTPVALDLSDPAHPTFTAPWVPMGGETLVFQLEVTDGRESSLDVVSVTVGGLGLPPWVDAGQDREVPEGALVELCAAWGDPDGPPPAITWWQQDSGPAVALEPSGQPCVRFLAPPVHVEGATLTFTFWAVDEDGLPGSDAVAVRVLNLNEPPRAEAGPDQAVDERTRVTLDGSVSADPDGDVLTFHWRQIAGTSVLLDSPNAVRPTFGAPSVTPGGETLTFELTVDDRVFLSDPDVVNVLVRNVNHPPVADAGDLQVVMEGVQVFLDGTHSYDLDSDPLRWAWSQRAGPSVELARAETCCPTFVAPSIGPAGETLEFALTVSDGMETATDVAIVNVENVNHPPIADAGPDQTRSEGAVVTLSGVSSHDPDGDPLRFLWNQVNGPPVVLSDAAARAPFFTAPAVDPGGTRLEFHLVVDDGLGGTGEDSVIISVANVNDPPFCSLARPSLAQLWPPNHKLVPVGLIGVTDPNNDAVTISITGVMQDEPVDGLGDGDTSPDAMLNGGAVLLRAERAGTGDGRVYRVEFTADDGSGGTCAGAVEVCVPHDRKDACVNGGAVADSTIVPR